MSESICKKHNVRKMIYSHFDKQVLKCPACQQIKQQLLSRKSMKENLLREIKHNKEQIKKAQIRIKEISQMPKDLTRDQIDWCVQSQITFRKEHNSPIYEVRK